MPYQIRKSGKPTHDKYYLSFAEASLAWRDAREESEVVEVNAEGDVVRRYTPQQCEEAATAYLSLRDSNEKAV